ncbi:MAG TPA: hypothetical protein VFW40_12640 [Capsulimonadaceae bacterium]|nr:hypothetical protein [Capsulimonadaceae bacterium]
MRDDELDRMDRAKVHRTVSLLLDLFVKRDYDAIARLDKREIVPVDLMRDAVHEWPYSLAIPPQDRIDELINALAIDNTNPQQWSVTVDFWTEEEERSSLTLVLTLTDSAGEYYTVEIDDIDVL